MHLDIILFVAAPFLWNSLPYMTEPNRKLESLFSIATLCFIRLILCKYTCVLNLHRKFCLYSFYCNDIRTYVHIEMQTHM